MRARLFLENLSLKNHSGLRVENVTLKVFAGEIVCLLGPSGSGKTSLLHLAAGVERQSSGRVLIEGQEVAGAQIWMPPETRRVGLIFQELALFPHLTVSENITFGLPKEEQKRRLEDMLVMINMEDKAHVYPESLSGGEQQRLALARALAPRPSILLMDEPFSSLDKALRDTLHEETSTILRKAQMACLMVTHDPEEAMRMADRIALMREGCVVQDDTPTTLYQAPKDAHVARFFGEVTELPGVVHNGYATAGPFHLPAPRHKNGENVQILLRCEALKPLESQNPQNTSEGLLIEGCVRHKRFLGRETLIHLEVAGVDTLVKARIGNPHTLEIDTHYHFALNPDLGYVFPIT